MGIATIWDMSSTDYGQNNFIRKHGTGQFQVDTKEAVLAILAQVVCSRNIAKIVLSVDAGHLVWTRNDGHDDRVSRQEEIDELRRDLEEYRKESREDYNLDDDEGFLI